LGVIEIDAAQQQELEKIRKRYRIRLLLAFGSRIKGFVHRDSDLDIGILYDGEQKSLEVAVDLQKVLPGYHLDIANLNHADPLLLNEVNKGCQLLSGNETEFQNFRIYAFHRYQDFKPYLELEAKINARHLESLKNAH
jgi:predicted nucleotidyltransferase